MALKRVSKYANFIINLDRDVGTDTESAQLQTRGNWVLTIVNTIVVIKIIIP